MSSTYRPICLNHDPALVIDHEWSRLDPAVELITAWGAGSTDDSLGDHVGCDLVIGRWSGALIEITCPPLPPTAPHNRHHAPETIGVEWLRLLCAAEAYPDLTELLGKVRRVNSCWHPGRLARLGRLLGSESW